MAPVIKSDNPLSCLFLFFLGIFVVSGIIILSPVILVLLIVLLFYALFAREKLTRANRRFRESDFAHRYFHTRANRSGSERNSPHPPMMDGKPGPWIAESGTILFCRPAY